MAKLMDFFGGFAPEGYAGTNLTPEQQDEFARNAMMQIGASMLMPITQIGPNPQIDYLAPLRAMAGLPAMGQQFAQGAAQEAMTQEDIEHERVVRERDAQRWEITKRNEELSHQLNLLKMEEAETAKSVLEQTQSWISEAMEGDDFKMLPPEVQKVIRSQVETGNYMDAYNSFSAAQLGLADEAQIEEERKKKYDTALRSVRALGLPDHLADAMVELDQGDFNFLAEQLQQQQQDAAGGEPSKEEIMKALGEKREELLKMWSRSVNKVTGYTEDGEPIIQSVEHWVHPNEPERTTGSESEVIGWMNEIMRTDPFYSEFHEVLGGGAVPAPEYSGPVETQMYPEADGQHMTVEEKAEWDRKKAQKDFEVKNQARLKTLQSWGVNMDDLRKQLRAGRYRGVAPEAAMNVLVDDLWRILEEQGIPRFLKHLQDNMIRVETQGAMGPEDIKKQEEGKRKVTAAGGTYGRATGVL